MGPGHGLGLRCRATGWGFGAYDEDFGQTLGDWRIPAGPYLVIPVLGPSTVRDGLGNVVDRIPRILLGFPPLFLYPVEAADTRANNPFRYGDIGFPFEYEMVRFLYLEQRKLLVAQ